MKLAQLMPHDPLIHPTACVEDPAEIGSGTRIWRFCHVSAGAQIGRGCSLGQNVFVGAGVRIGNGARIQNNVSLYSGVELADYVFCGPSCVFTNVMNPRAEIDRKHEFKKTHVGRGATIGANATIVCGVTIGRYAFVAAGAVVTRDVPDYALMMGTPARQGGWMSRHGQRLGTLTADEEYVCSQSGFRYQLVDGNLRCLTLAEDTPLETEVG